MLDSPVPSVGPGDILREVEPSAVAGALQHHVTEVRPQLGDQIPNQLTGTPASRYTSVLRLAQYMFLVSCKRHVRLEWWLPSGAGKLAVA